MLLVVNMDNNGFTVKIKYQNQEMLEVGGLWLVLIG